MKTHKTDLKLNGQRGQIKKGGIETQNTGGWRAQTHEYVDSSKR
jgi:hypothetical protein